MKNIALVGAGYWGKNLARSLSELGVLHAICDQAEEIREAMQKLYKDVLVVGDFESVLKDEAVTGIVLASPAIKHFEQAKQALLAGKHVFVEKPLSLRAEDGEELIKIAEAQKKILFVGHILHYHPAVIKMKKIIAEGTIGKLQYIYSNRLNLGKIRTEENILWSFAPHDISLILGLTGEEHHHDKPEVPVGCRRAYFCKLAEPLQGTETGRHRFKRNAGFRRHEAHR
jgi:UDP-2-acetamido-3-amino-2,3-dideoxy-glucuronate N-acetyltransferase